MNTHNKKGVFYSKKKKISAFLGANFHLLVYRKKSKIKMSDTYVQYIKIQISDQKIKNSKKITVFLTLNNNFIKSRAKKNMEP